MIASLPLRFPSLLPLVGAALMLAGAAQGLELTAEQQQLPLEMIGTGGGAAQIVLIAGEPSNKPGQHEYLAGCALIHQWLRGVPGVTPVLVAGGWPQRENLLDSARAVLFFMDGGDKLAFLPAARWQKVEQLAKAGVGLAILHQGVDVPAAQASQFQGWFGAVFDPKSGCRGHWDVDFKQVPAHPITAGMAPFPLLKDGWLYHLQFAPTGVTPLLSAQMPESSRKSEAAKAHAGRDEVVAWAYERPGGGRSFGFTGADLHSNWGEAQQRRLVLGGLLWAAGLEVPAGGLAPEVSAQELAANWDRKLFTAKPKGKGAAKTAKPKVPAAK
jgi:type 1 glutamine amidotransferase